MTEEENIVIGETFSAGDVVVQLKYIQQQLMSIQDVAQELSRRQSMLENTVKELASMLDEMRQNLAVT